MFFIVNFIIDQIPIFVKGSTKKISIKYKQTFLFCLTNVCFVCYNALVSVKIHAKYPYR